MTNPNIQLNNINNRRDTSLVWSPVPLFAGIPIIVYVTNEGNNDHNEPCYKNR